MPLTYTAEVQNRISGLVTNALYSSLNATDKAIMDGTTSAPLSANTLPSGGVARDAFVRVRYLVSLAEMLGTNGSGDVTDAAEGWFCYLTASLWAAVQRPDRLSQLKSLADNAEQTFFESFQRIEPDAYSSEFGTLTLQAIRYYCMMACIRRTPRVIPSWEQIDSAVFETVNQLWHKLSWMYRLRALTATVDTSSAVTWSGSETVVSLETRKLYLQGTAGDYISWADADQMALLKANTAASAGKPIWFRVTKAGDTWNWQFYPTPDQTYTFNAQVAVALPGTPTGAPSSLTDTTVFAKFPSAVQAFVKRLCLNRLLINLSANDAAALRDDSDDTMERLFQTIDDIGTADADQSTRDVYQDTDRQGSVWYGSPFGGLR